MRPPGPMPPTSPDVQAVAPNPAPAQDFQPRPWDWMVVAGALVMFVSCTMENHSRAGRIAGAVGTIAGVLWGWRAGAVIVSHMRLLALSTAAVLVASLVSAFASIDPEFSIRTLFRQHLWFGLLFLSMAVWATNRWRQWAILGCLAAAAAYASTTGVLLFRYAEAMERAGWIRNAADFVYTATDASGNVYRRAEGLLESYTRSAMLYFAMMPAVLMLAVDSWKRRRWGLLAALVLVILLSCLYVLLTKARGAWIACALAAIVTLALAGARWWTTLGLVVAMVVVGLALPTVRARAITFVSDLGNPDLLVSGRMELWGQAWRPISQHPFTGVGYGGDIFTSREGIRLYELRSVDRRQPDLHNLYLQTLAEVGIIGAIAYLWWLGVLLARVGSTMRLRLAAGAAPAAGAAIAMLVAALVSGIVYTMNEDHFAQIGWTLLGTLGATAAISADRPEAPPGDSSH